MISNAFSFCKSVTNACGRQACPEETGTDLGVDSVNRVPTLGLLVKNTNKGMVALLLLPDGTLRTMPEKGLVKNHPLFLKVECGFFAVFICKVGFDKVSFVCFEDQLAAFMAIGVVIGAKLQAIGVTVHIVGENRVEKEPGSSRIGLGIAKDAMIQTHSR